MRSQGFPGECAIAVAQWPCAHRTSA
jgi:hypothetical protein